MSLEISFSTINTLSLFIYGLKPSNTLRKDSVNSPHYLKKKNAAKPGAMAHTFKPSAREAGAGEAL